MYRSLLTLRESSHNNRIAEVGRDLWKQSGPNHLLKQNHLQQVAQNHLQMVFKFLQGWGFHDLSGQPAPVLSHPHTEEVFPWCSESLLWFSVCPLPLILQWVPIKTAWLSLLCFFPSGIYINLWDPLSLLFSQLSHSFLQERWSSP